MKKRIKNISLIFLFLLFVFSGKSEVTLPKLISDGMVLQRQINVKIWGWAAVRENVTIRFIDSTYETVADTSGKWEIILPVLQAGGPYNMVIAGGNKITIKDILVGDVWVCSGQSNMETTMQRVSPLYQEEIKNAGNNSIRYFTVPKTYNFNTPQNDLRAGNWISPNPNNILQFSAVAYFYAKALYDSIHVPIGLINASLGGSPIEAWIDEESIKEFPKYYQEALRFKNQDLIDSIQTHDQVRIRSWYKQLNNKDKGYQYPDKIWSAPTICTSDWQTMTLPGYWADTPLGYVNGTVWFRKEIQVPVSMAGQPAKLLLGRIVDADSVFVNGAFVGTTSYQYPPRRYVIPSSVLKEGRNTLIIRVISNSGRGGFVPDKTYQLLAGNQTINLTGKWQYKLGAEMKPLAGQTFIRWKPVGLYNAMISPLQNFCIKGVVWYQGESNADRPMEYRDLFQCLVQSWRAKWHQGDFPFLFVQLPNYMEPQEQPSESNWALLRESQMKVLALPNTGMVVAIDLGEWNDIHPLNKKDVGKRLSLLAQKMACGNDQIISLSPLFKSMEVEGSNIVLTFKNTGSGLMSQGRGELKQFSISGKDRHFVWGEAKVVGTNRVIVSSKYVPHPVAVRYAWANNPDGANLYNNEGLPAAPFRTDQWTNE